MVLSYCSPGAKTSYSAFQSKSTYLYSDSSGSPEGIAKINHSFKSILLTFVEEELGVYVRVEGSIPIVTAAPAILISRVKGITD